MKNDTKYKKDINYILLINWFLTSTCLSSSNFKSIGLIRQYLNHEMEQVLKKHYNANEVEDFKTIKHI